MTLFCRYQAPLLTKLNDPDEADEFIKGRMPEPAAKVNPASIVGLFSSEDTEGNYQSFIRSI